MPCARKYSKEDVNAILQASEGRRSPVSGEPGHALSRHVGVNGLQISDRLRGTVMTSASRPMVMMPTGGGADASTVRAVWREIDARNGITTTTNQLKKDYRKLVENYIDDSGAFVDLQQAIIIGRYLLNSSDGQAELAKLDAGTETRIKIAKSLHQIEAVDGAWKMNYAGMPTAGNRENDITHLEDIRTAFMLVDRYDAGNIHIQTFYPIKG
jgi:hypothetical protein